MTPAAGDGAGSAAWVRLLLAQALGTLVAGRRPGWFWPAQAATLVGGGLWAWRGGAAAGSPPARLPRAVAVGGGWYAMVVAAAAVARHTGVGRRALRDLERRRGAAPAGWRLVIVPVAAAGEELVWRGAVLAGCRRRLGPRPGSLAAAGAAGAVQLLSGNRLFPLAAAGWAPVATWLCDASGSVWPAAAAHAVWSALTLGWPGLPSAVRHR